MAGFERILIICPPHLVPKWKREVEMTVPGVRAAIVESITDLERLRLYVGPGPRLPVRVGAGDGAGKRGRAGRRGALGRNTQGEVVATSEPVSERLNDVVPPHGFD